MISPLGYGIIHTDKASVTGPAQHEDLSGWSTLSWCDKARPCFVRQPKRIIDDYGDPDFDTCLRARSVTGSVPLIGGSYLRHNISLSPDTYGRIIFVWDIAVPTTSAVTSLREVVYAKNLPCLAALRRTTERFSCLVAPSQGTPGTRLS